LNANGEGPKLEFRTWSTQACESNGMRAEDSDYAVPPPPPPLSMPTTFPLRLLRTAQIARPTNLSILVTRFRVARSEIAFRYDSHAPQSPPLSGRRTRRELLASPPAPAATPAPAPAPGSTTISARIQCRMEFATTSRTTML